MRTLSRIVVLLAVVLSFLVATSPAPAQPPPATYARTPAQTYSQQAFETTNNQRVRRDLVRLRKGHCLARFAAGQAERMAARRRIFHQDLRPVLRRCGMRMVGENVAAGFPTGRAAVNYGWMRSPGHRANILRPGWRRMAIAARKAGGRWYVAQVFGRH